MKKFIIPYKLVVNPDNFIIFWNEEDATISKTYLVRIVCDIDDENKLIGIELLGFSYYTEVEPNNVSYQPKNFNNNGVISYDKSVDAFYFKLNDKKPEKQKSIDGILMFDDQKKLIALKGMMSL